VFYVVRLVVVTGAQASVYRAFSLRRARWSMLGTSSRSDGGNDGRSAQLGLEDVRWMEVGERDGSHNFLSPFAPRPLMAFVSDQSVPSRGTWLLTNTKPPYTLCMPGITLSPRVRCR
jgi:hypothetical protein